MYQRYFQNISRTVHEELNALDCLWNFDNPEQMLKDLNGINRNAL